MILGFLRLFEKLEITIGADELDGAGVFLLELGGGFREPRQGPAVGPSEICEAARESEGKSGEDVFHQGRMTRRRRNWRAARVVAERTVRVEVPSPLSVMVSN